MSAHLLQRRQNYRWTWIDTVVLIASAVCTLVVAYAAPHFYDEAQTWLGATHNSFWQIVSKFCGYEGVAAIWPLTVWLVAHLGINFTQLHWVGAALTIGATAVWLRYCSLPAMLRYLLPFSFWFVYEPAAVARPLCWFPLLMGLSFAFYAMRRPVPFAIFCALTANLALPAAAPAGGLALAFAYEEWKRSQVSMGTYLRRNLPMVMILVAGFTLAAAVAFPPRDAFDGQAIFARLGFKPSTTGTPPPWTQQIMPPAPPKPPFLIRQWRSPRWGIPLFSISGSSAVAFSFLVLYATWLYKRRRFVLVLAPFCFLLAGEALFVGAYHTAMFFICMVGTAWLAWPESSNDHGWQWTKAMGAALVLILLLHITWSVRTSLYELRNGTRFGGQYAAAKYLRSFPAGTRFAAINYNSSGVVAFPSTPTYENRPDGYFHFQISTNSDNHFAEEMEKRPQVIVVSASIGGPEDFGPQRGWPVDWDANPWQIPGSYLEHNGYQQAHHFCQDWMLRGGVSIRECDLIYVRKDVIAPPMR